MSSFKLSALLTLFLILGVAMLIWPVISAIEIFDGFQERSDVVDFDKGAFYLIGGGLFFLILSVGGMISFRVNDNFAKTYAKIIGTLILVSLILVFLVPMLAHYYADTAFKRAGYEVCDNKSSRWLHASTIVYTKNNRCD